LIRGLRRVPEDLADLLDLRGRFVRLVLVSLRGRLRQQLRLGQQGRLLRVLRPGQQLPVLRLVRRDQLRRQVRQARQLLVRQLVQFGRVLRPGLGRLRGRLGLAGRERLVVQQDRQAPGCSNSRSVRPRRSFGRC
jgi:hypothetical protein